MLKDPVNGHVGTGSVPSPEVTDSVAPGEVHLHQCRPHGQETEGTIVQQENYGIVAIMATWWSYSHIWTSAIGGHKLFRSCRRGSRDDVVALVIESFYCQKLNVGDNRIDCLWIRSRGRPPRQISW